MGCQYGYCLEYTTTGSAKQVSFAVVKDSINKPETIALAAAVVAFLGTITTLACAIYKKLGKYLIVYIHM